VIPSVQVGKATSATATFSIINSGLLNPCFQKKKMKKK